MTKRRLGETLIGLGGFPLMAAVLSWTLSVEAGFRNIWGLRILGIELGLSLVAIGYILRTSSDSGEGQTLLRLRDWIMTRPLLVWLLAGMSIAFLWLFLWPVFLNAELHILYYTDFIPVYQPIGEDLARLLKLSGEWFQSGKSPYRVQYYPPLTYFLFTPLTIFPYPLSYYIYTPINFLSYVLLTLALPLLIQNKRNLTTIMLIFLAGLLSYGLQFELERGQNNVLAVLLAVLGIYIFHFRHEYRLLAYLLFSISIQLKLYPAIFILMLVKDWRDWKGILRRATALGIVNFALLFVMGYDEFLNFVRVTFDPITREKWFAYINHSAESFSRLLVDGLLGTSNGLYRMTHGIFDGSQLANVLVAGFLLCLGMVIFKAWRANKGGFDSYLFMLCMLGTLLLPISNDYKLSLLPVAITLFFNGISWSTLTTRQRWVAIPLVIITAAAFTVAMFPVNFKPELLQNSFLPVYVIMISTTLLALLDGPGHPQEAPASLS